MNRLAIELLRIAREFDLMNEEEVPNAVKPVQTEIKVPARIRNYLEKFARGLPGNIDDNTDIVSKAIEHMQEGHGDDYYDYDSLTGFFNDLKLNVNNFVGLREYGLDDVAEKLSDELDKNIEFSEVYDDSVIDELDPKLTRAFCDASQKYLKATISTVADMAWEGLDEVLENIVNSFYIISNIDPKSTSLGEAQGEFLKIYDEQVNDVGNLIGFLNRTGPGNASAVKKIALKKFSESYARRV